MPELENWLPLKKTLASYPILPRFVQQLCSEMAKEMGRREEGREGERDEKEKKKREDEELGRVGSCILG